MIQSPPDAGLKTRVTPSSANCSSACFKCFDFIGSVTRTRCNISGAKFGMPVMRMGSLSVKVSPILRLP